MKKIICPSLLALVLLLSACASQPRRTIINNDSEGAAVSEEAAIVTAPSREPVFIYSNCKSIPARLILTLAGEPVLLPSGYIRLVGVVSGGRRAACLEIGGRGLALEEGERIDAYRMVRISGDTVVLEKTK